MRSLFVKIFAWFWVAMTLVIFASMVSSMATQSHPFFIMPWLRFLFHPPTESPLKLPPPETQPGGLAYITGNIVRLAGRTAVKIYERNGKEALARFVDDLESEVPIRIFLFDAQKEQIAGKKASQSVQDLAEKTRGGWLELRRWEESFAMAQQISDSRGAGYVLVAQFPARHFTNRDPPVPVLHLVVILITAGGLCYWLARYITTPIRRLRTAARRLAAGDLKVRVGASAGRRNDEIADLGKDFDIMAERIDSLMTAQKRLLRDISHEFRSPLTRLTIALELARQQGGSEAPKALDRIAREAGRLNELIARLLTLSRLESGVEKTDGEPVDMADLVEEIVADADFEAQGHNCSVRILAIENCIVFGTRELLRSAIENVLRNAIRYTLPETAVEVSLQCRAVEGGFLATIRVRDYGRGVPEKSLSDLFYPFYRVGDARDRKAGGTGLGLAITERAVKLHDGRLAAANAPGGGLVVSIDLPAAAMP